MIKDRDRKLKQMEFEKEFMENDSGKLMEEEEKYIEDFLKDYGEKEEDLKEIIIKQNRVNFIARLFQTKEDWKKRFLEMKEFKVLKYQRVLQSVMYLLEYRRD